MASNWEVDWKNEWLQISEPMEKTCEDVRAGVLTGKIEEFMKTWPITKKMFADGLSALQDKLTQLTVQMEAVKFAKRRKILDDMYETYSDRMAQFKKISDRISLVVPQCSESFLYSFPVLSSWTEKKTVQKGDDEPEVTEWKVEAVMGGSVTVWGSEQTTAMKDFMNEVEKYKLELEENAIIAERLAKEAKKISEAGKESEALIALADPIGDERMESVVGGEGIEIGKQRGESLEIAGKIVDVKYYYDRILHYFVEDNYKLAAGKTEMVYRLKYLSGMIVDGIHIANKLDGKAEFQAESCWASNVPVWKEKLTIMNSLRPDEMAVMTRFGTCNVPCVFVEHKATAAMKDVSKCRYMSMIALKQLMEMSGYSGDGLFKYVVPSFLTGYADEAMTVDLLLVSYEDGKFVTVSGGDWELNSKEKVCKFFTTFISVVKAAKRYLGQFWTLHERRIKDFAKTAIERQGNVGSRRFSSTGGESKKRPFSETGEHRAEQSGSKRQTRSQSKKTSNPDPDYIPGAKQRMSDSSETEERKRKKGKREDSGGEKTVHSMIVSSPIGGRLEHITEVTCSTRMNLRKDAIYFVGNDYLTGFKIFVKVFPPESFERAHVEESTLAILRGTDSVPTYQPLIHLDRGYSVLMTKYYGEDLDIFTTAVTESSDRDESLESLWGETILFQLKRILHCVHSKNVLHGDLKPSNICVMRHENDLEVTLVDWDRAVVGERLKGHRATQGFEAPETSKRGIYTTLSETFAYGMIVQFLLIRLEGMTENRALLDEMNRALDVDPSRRFII